MRKKGSAWEFFRKYGLDLLLTAGLFWLTYTVVMNFSRGLNDHLPHAVWAIAMTPEDFLNAFVRGRERLWHALVKLCFELTSNIWASAAVVTAAANAAAHFLACRALKAAVPERVPRWLVTVLVHLSFIANALTWPGAPFVTDRGYMNMWHNPTNIMVRPFAAAVFFMTLRIYRRRGGGQFSFDGGFGEQFKKPVYAGAEVVLYPLCLLLSVYAKPAFLQFFAPAMFILFLIDLARTRGRIFPFYLKLALAYLPALAVFFMQFMHYFGAFISPAEAQAAAEAVAEVEQAVRSGELVLTDGESALNAAYNPDGVAFYYIRPVFTGLGEVLALTADALLQTVYLCAFPLCVYLADLPDSRRGAAFRLSLIGVIAARLESLLFHEPGIREGDGNFRWGYFLAVWLFWLAAVERYARRLTERSRAGRLMRYAATPLLAWQTATGVIYVARILQTADYWF